VYITEESGLVSPGQRAQTQILSKGAFFFSLLFKKCDKLAVI